MSLYWNLSNFVFLQFKTFNGKEDMSTYHSWSWIGDFSLEGDPLVVGPLLVSKGPQEGPPDVVHGVETHSWAFKYTATGEQGALG